MSSEKCLRQRLFNFTAAVSTGLLVAVVILMARSYLSPVTLVFTVSPVRKVDVSFYGRFLVLREFDPTQAAPFANHHGIYKHFSLWPLVALTGALPLLSLSFWVVHRRKTKEDGKCVVCGYDLRATPDRCPECGTIPPAAKGAAV